MNNDKFYTIKEVAEILKVPERLVKRMIKSKKIRALNISAGGGIRPNWRIYEKEMDRFISEEYERRAKDS